MTDRNTIMFNTPVPVPKKTMQETLAFVYDALEERGYNPLDQIVGYLLSGDPSYITSHNNARNLIRELDRDDLAEELIRSFLNK